MRRNRQCCCTVCYGPFGKTVRSIRYPLTDDRISEYLKWDPQRFNNTRAISIDPWKIWQPSFALYNSAKGNNWLINMYSMPATLSYEGRIYSSGTYSFEVTCAFDFSNYPYDEQV